MKNLPLLLLSVVVPLCTYSQNNEKIIPVQEIVKQNVFNNTKWGYKDILGNWIITPQFDKAYAFNNDGIATVDLGIKNVMGILPYLPFFSMFISEKYVSIEGLIDLNGDILVQYNTAQQQKDIKYKKALKIVSKRSANGAYDDVYAKLAQADFVMQQRILQAQIEQARRDSILLVKREQKRLADSVAMAKKAIADSIKMAQREQKRLADSVIIAQKAIADSIILFRKNRIKALPLPGQGLSLNKVKITGYGLLLSKDKTFRQYTVSMDDFNRLFVAYKGESRYRGELDVLKVIYESEWGLLSDDLFHSVEITKATAEITNRRSGRTERFGVFSFLFTLNIDDLDTAQTNEEVNITTLNAIYQVNKYIDSFINHYQNASYFVEPLFQVTLGGREGIDVGIVDKQGTRVSLEDIERVCTESRRKFDAHPISQ